MQWIEASINTKPEEIETLCERLTDLGVQGVSIEDETDLNRFLKQNKEYWDYIDESLSEKFRGLSRVKFYVIDDADGRQSLSRIQEEIAQEISVKRIDDQDWEYTWRDNYKPIEIGKRLLVLPEWMEPESGEQKRVGLESGGSRALGAKPGVCGPGALETDGSGPGRAQTGGVCPKQVEVAPCGTVRKARHGMLLRGAYNGSVSNGKTGKGKNL